MLDSAQQLYQRPGRTACFIEHIVNFEPGRGLTQLAAIGQRGTPDTGRQALRQRTKTGTDVADPTGQVVGTGIEIGLPLAQTGDVAVERLDAIAILAFAGGHGPAVVIKVKTRLGLDQIPVLGGLRLGACHVTTQRAGHVPHLDQHAVLPAGHVIHQQTGRHDVVTQVPAGLVQ